MGSVGTEVWCMRLSPSQTTGQCTVLGTIKGKHSSRYTRFLEVSLQLDEVQWFMNTDCTEHGFEEQCSWMPTEKHGHHGAHPHTQWGDTPGPGFSLEWGHAVQSASDLFLVVLLCFHSCSLCFHLTAVLFKADFGLPFLSMFPWMWICEVHLWLFCPSASHCFRLKRKCLAFQKICAKFGDSLETWLRVCSLLHALCMLSSVWHLQHSGSHTPLCGFHTHLRMQLSFKDYRTCYMDYCFWRNSSNVRFVRFTDAISSAV